jgi:hypothetical protein
LCWTEVSWWLIYYTRTIVKNHRDVSARSSLTDDCQLSFQMFDQQGSFNRLIWSCNCMTILCAHDFLKTLPQIQILDLPKNCEWSTYLMFGVASNLDLEHLHPHLLFEPLLVLPHPTSNANYSLIPTHLSMKVVSYFCKVFHVEITPPKSWGFLCLLVWLESPPGVGVHRFGFIMFGLTVEKLWNIEQFFHWKFIQIKTTKL